MDEYKKEMYAKDLSPTPRILHLLLHHVPTRQPGNERGTSSISGCKKKMHTIQAIDDHKKDALYKKRTPNSKKRKPEVRLKRTLQF